VLPAGAQPGPAPAAARADTALQARLEALTTGFEGDVGLYVRHLPSGRTAALNADSLFPTASMVKVPILVKTFDLIDRGVLDAKQKLTYYADSVAYPHSPWELLAFARDSVEIEIDRLVLLMLSLSENAASVWLQKTVGTGTAINDWLAANGFEKTRVNARTPGREAAYEAYGWGQTTPREMAALLVMIREGRAVSPAASEEMYRSLTRSYWNDGALSQLPPTVQAAAKNGALDASRSEVVLVNAPHGDYVFCVVTKNQRDTSWAFENAGMALLRAVSRALWQHFEPGSGWRPAEGIDRYRQ
jgi:beta-lactamase class A